MKESGELVFLKYAFPAVDCCSQGQVDEKERREFIKMLKEGGNPDRNRLEELFPNAVKNLKSWDEKDVRDYWCREHNKIFADNPLCRVYGWQVTEIGSGLGVEVCRVRVEGIKEEFASYIPLIGGDYFTTHNLIVAEKLTPPQYNEYFGKKR